MAENKYKLKVKICKEVVDKCDFLEALKDSNNSDGNYYIFTDSKDYIDNIKEICKDAIVNDK